jgi:hypothetical protein
MSEPKVLKNESKATAPFDTKNQITDNLNAIGDAAGNFLTVQALLAKMPQDAFTLFLGDLNDRGPRTKQLIQHIIDNPDKMDSVDSNHGEMFVDFYKTQMLPGQHLPRYDAGVFLGNGGGKTLASYRDGDTSSALVCNLIPYSHIKWLDTRPMYRYNDKYFFSHAPIFIDHTFEKITSRGQGFYGFQRPDPVSRGNLLWNRYPYAGFHNEIGPKINIYGHNSRSKPVLFCKQYQNGIKITSNDQLKELLELNAGQVWGIDIDTSSSSVLTGLHLPTMTIYQQDYID